MGSSFPFSSLRLVFREILIDGGSSFICELKWSCSNFHIRAAEEARKVEGLRGQSL